MCDCNDGLFRRPAYVRNSNVRQLSVQACVDEFDDGLSLRPVRSDFNRRMSLRLVYVCDCNDGLFLRPISK